MDEVTEDQEVRGQLATEIPAGVTVSCINDDSLVGREYAVSTPRCVFDSDKPFMGDDGLPASPCSPPYGYPLYYKRATKIGMPEAGIAKIGDAKGKLLAKESDVATKINKYSQVANAQLDAFEYTRMRMKERDATDEEILTVTKKISDLTTEANKKLAALGGIEKELQVTNQANATLYKVIDRLSKESEKNAHKVYEFVRGIADQHLGKTYLVKIPQKCNVNYSPNIVADQTTFEIKRGPFAFQPRPISTIYGLGSSSGFLQGPNMVALRTQAKTYNEEFPFNHYLDVDESGSSYTYGALKNNYNPVSEEWEFNYVPMPQGGFFNFASFNKTLSYSESLTVDTSKLPPLTQQELVPADLKNFVENNGRIKCYVRFDNSQNLNFSNISKDSICQQQVKGATYIPDLMDNVSNTTTEDIARQGFFPLDPEDRIKAVAFVKCDLDQNLYMCPETNKIPLKVFARKVRISRQNPVLQEKEITLPDGSTEIVPVQQRPYINFIPASPSGGFDGTIVSGVDFQRRFDKFTQSYLVETEVENLNPEHVFAIITIPGRVQPIVDVRFMDGPRLAFNSLSIKHALTADVVKGVEGFDMPGYLGQGIDFLKSTKNGQSVLARDHNGNRIEFQFTNKTQSSVQACVDKLNSDMISALPEAGIVYSMPSPVYPDIVAIPLMSQERCYGPWLSSVVQNNPLDSGVVATVRYSDIGGKVEFIKDENLAPWNYAGYQLMNEAGALRAQFSNSLQLFVERGGFVMAEAPTGISLARELQNLGPLVTSITVDVDQSIKTTVKMDLYTSKFGKLQKQKETTIGQMVRQRQKQIDLQNNNIRHGLTKGFSNQDGLGTNISLSSVDGIATQMQGYLSNLEKNTTVYDRLVATLKTTVDSTINLIDNSDAVTTDSVTLMSVQSESFEKEAKQNFTDQNALDQNDYNSVSLRWDEIATPYSNEVHHGSDMGGFPCRIYVNPQAQFDLGSI